MQTIRTELSSRLKGLYWTLMARDLSKLCRMHGINLRKGSRQSFIAALERHDSDVLSGDRTADAALDYLVKVYSSLPFHRLKELCEELNIPRCLRPKKSSNSNSQLVSLLARKQIEQLADEVKHCEKIETHSQAQLSLTNSRHLLKRDNAQSDESGEYCVEIDMDTTDEQLEHKYDTSSEAVEPPSRFESMERKATSLREILLRAHRNRINNQNRKRAPWAVDSIQVVESPVEVLPCQQEDTKASGEHNGVFIGQREVVLRAETQAACARNRDTNDHEQQLAVMLTQLQPKSRVNLSEVEPRGTIELDEEATKPHRLMPARKKRRMKDSCIAAEVYSADTLRSEVSDPHTPDSRSTATPEPLPKRPTYAGSVQNTLHSQLMDTIEVENRCLANLSVVAAEEHGPLRLSLQILGRLKEDLYRKILQN